MPSTGTGQPYTGSFTYLMQALCQAGGGGESDGDGGGCGVRASATQHALGHLRFMPTRQNDLNRLRKTGCVAISVASGQPVLTFEAAPPGVAPGENAQRTLGSSVRPSQGDADGDGGGGESDGDGGGGETDGGGGAGGGDTPAPQPPQPPRMLPPQQELAHLTAQSTSQ